MSEIPAYLPEEPFLSACVAEADEALILPVLDGLRAMGVRICYEKASMELLIKDSRACLFFLTSAAVTDPVFRRLFTQNFEKQTLAAVIRQPVLPPVVEAQLLQCRHRLFIRLSPEALYKWLEKLPEAAACIGAAVPANVHGTKTEPSRPQWELCCLRTGRTMRLSWGQTIRIGRKQDACQFTVPDSASISRIHAELQSTETGWTLTDLRTTNGTRLNGVQLEPDTAAALQPGDRFSLGKEAFTIRIAEEK